jgi:sulfite reductase (NADPH) flavoprotein alpha-component
LSSVGLDGQEIIKLDDLSTGAQTGITSVEKLFVNYLDIFGKPSREFLKQLFPFATDVYEKTAIAELTLDRNLKEFQAYTDMGFTFADYILKYPSLKIPAEKYVEIIPTIKQRVYSICSSTRLRPGKCQLLVVVNDWQASDGETKLGLCSDFLSKTRANQFVLCHPTHSVMQMPRDHSAPIYMVGLGTGLAPFRAFIEERKWAKSNGKKVGKMTLFFGGRYSKKEYYYSEEMEAYEQEGLLQCFHAWSRDTDKKVYVQHRIQESSAAIWQDFGAPGSNGHLYLCGPKQPEKDVYAALLSIFQTRGGLAAQQAETHLATLKDADRYVTEVY